MLHTLYRDPFILGHPQIHSMGQGCTLGEIVKRTPNLPHDFAWTGEITVNGELVFRDQWDRIRPKDGTVVAMHAHIGGGGGGGKQVFGLIAAIALTVITGGIASGALAPFLGASFAAGTLGASVLAGAVGIVGALAISAITAPPTTRPGAEQSESGLRLEAASVDGNLLEPNTPVPRVIGTRKFFPPFLSEPIIELIGQDEYVEAIWGAAGAHQLEDIRLGDAAIDTETDEQKDIEIELRNGLPGESPVTLTNRQGRTTEPNIQLSVHIVDPENQDTIEGPGPEFLPVFHSLTTRIAPDENWIHLHWAGLAEEGGLRVRVPFRIRMRRRGDTVWRDLPEFHYQNDTQSQIRTQIKIYWGDPWTDSLTTPPADLGWVEARNFVPAQDVQPLGTNFNADSYFAFGGGGQTFYTASTAGTTDMRNVLLYSDKIEIYLDEDEWEPGIWDIEIKRGAAFLGSDYTTSNYEYNGDVLDFFGRRESGVLPITRENLLDQVTLIRLVNVWNEHPINQEGMTLVAVKARNRAVQKLSAIASGYVPDLPFGRGPTISSITSTFLSFKSVSESDVELLALIRPTAISDTDNPESVYIAVRGADLSASKDLYQFGLANLVTDDGAFNAVAIERYVDGAKTTIETAAFPWQLNKNFFLRFRVEGTSLKGKAWPATLSEPDDWLIEVTDANVTGPGRVGLHVVNNGDAAMFNWFSVGVDGDPAPAAGVLGELSTDFSDDAVSSDVASSPMLLLHFDGTPGSTTFTDSSLSPKTFTAVGNAQLASGGVFGQCLRCDGNGDYTTTPDSVDFSLGSAPFTLQFRFRCTAAGGTFKRILGQNDSNGTAGSRSFAALRTSDNIIRCGVSDGTTEYEIFGTTQFTDVVNPGFHHVAFVRTGNTLKMFIDGVQEGGDLEFTGSVFNSTNLFAVGTTGQENNAWWEGDIDEVILHRGVALWTENFTPPTAATTIGSDDWTPWATGIVGVVSENSSLPYNGNATEWSELHVTSNPAPHFRDVLTGSLNFDPLPGSLLDDPGLVTWWRRCSMSDFTCNMVVEGLEVPDLLRVVSSCGYGRLYRSEIFGAIMDYDRSSETPVQVFTPRNSSGMSWRKAFARLPAGFRVNFRESELDYGTDQVIILRDDIEGTSARLEQTTYDGLVNRQDVITRARFDLLQAERRAAFYTFNAPVESIVCRRGDLIGVNHDILLAQYGYARIIDVFYDEDAVTGVTLDSTVEIFNEEDVLQTFDLLEVEDILTLGMVSGVSIRQTDGQVTTHRLHPNTVTSETDEIHFETPIPVKYGYRSPFDRNPVHAIAADCLLVVGDLGSEYKRFVVSEIAPQVNLEAQIVCVDEASDMFQTVFGGG